VAQSERLRPTSAEGLGRDRRGEMVLELDDSQLLKLGVPAAEHKKYRAKAFADLKRLGETPKDVFEWRAANIMDHALTFSRHRLGPHLGATTTRSTRPLRCSFG
jgi:hypothetical protein